MLHGLVARSDGTAELRFGYVLFLGYLVTRYHAPVDGAPEPWPFRKLDKGFMHLLNAARDLAWKIELAATRYAEASKAYLGSLDSPNGIVGNHDMSVMLDALMVYLRLLPDLVADSLPYFYTHPQPSSRSFREQRKWFKTKRPDVDPEYVGILKTRTGWFDELAGKDGDDSEKGLRDLLIHRFGHFQFPVVVGSSWSDERVTADLVSKAGYNEGVESRLRTITRDQFSYLDAVVAHLNERVESATSWAPLSKLDGTGCKLRDFSSPPPSKWLFPMAAL